MTLSERVDNVSELLDIAERCTKASQENGADGPPFLSLRKSALIIANSLMTEEVTKMLGEIKTSQRLPRVYEDKK